MTGTARVAELNDLRPPAHFLAFVGALVAIGPLTMDAYLPALPAIANDFAVSAADISVTVSAYLLGYAVGQFFGGPLSDQVGRKTVGMVGLALFVTATLGILAAGTLEQVLVWRFLQALGGGCATVISIALVRDIYSPVEAGRRFAMVMMIVMLAPLAAPAAGTYLLHFGWHAIFWLFTAYAVALFFTFLLSIPETHPAPGRRISLPSVFAQYRAVLTRRTGGRWVAMRFPLAMASSGSVLMVFITQSAFLYMHHFQVSTDLFPVLFGANVIMLVTGNFVSMKLLGRIHPQLLFRAGMAVQLTATAGLFLLVWSGIDQLYPTVPLIVLAVGSVGLINPAGMTLYMSHYPKQGGSASAAFTTLMFSLGGLLGSLPNLFPGHGLLPTAGVMLGASLIANGIAHTIPAVDLDRAAVP